MGLISATKKGAHYTHRILQKISPVYAKATRDHENRKKLRKQKAMRKRVRQDYHGRHR